MRKLGLSGQSQHDWRERYEANRAPSAAAAIQKIQRGERIFIASNCGVPQVLIRALVDDGQHLADCEIVHLLTRGDAPTADPRLADRFRHNAFFVGANVREAVNRGQADYTPIFLSEVPALFRSRTVPLDVALIMVTPPDAHGFCSLGIAVDVAKAAVESADRVIAQINPRMPRTHGDSFVHVDRLTAVLEHEEALPEYPPGEIDVVSAAIGRHVATLVADGATVQAGIGKIPDAVLAALGGKKDLGIHTEMFSDGVVDLVASGVITGRKKSLHPGKIVAGFCMGTQRLYDFVHDNPVCEFRPTEYVNDPFLIAQHDNMVAVNSAIEVDLTGQVCADSLGPVFFSGFGGQVDFVRGAARSRNGRPVICLPSTAKKGAVSRIVPYLQHGAGVTTSRGDVHFVATEWGVADLHGRSVRERALALIQIAHPRFRKDLFAEARQRGVLDQDTPDPVEVDPSLGELEFDVSLRNGQEAHVRAARLTDERALQEMWYDLSERTILRRYNTERRTLPRQRVRELLSFDGTRDLMLVATVPAAGGRQRIIGTGRYNTDRGTGYAELGILIHDDFQSQGLGSFFMAALAKNARKNHVRGFTGAVAVGNYSALELFQSTGQTVEVTTEDGICHLRFTFPEHADAHP
ncbi:MAG: GNAT family N-acetyltransferase [Pseudomonadota bacterium]